ncbi:MAG TPA: hypothetical protein VK589_05085 [Chryseolinea sp.]|nr:hypothetical protein [Chryseolinea sp.]
MSDNEFYTGAKPPINFTLKVIATDLPLSDPAFKMKIVFDFVPTFSQDARSDAPNFHGNKVYRIMNFITQRVIKKVIEWIYYDRGNEANARANELKLPHNYPNAIAIYDERQKIKASCEQGDLSYLDHREERATTKEGDCIEDIVGEFFNRPDRPIWEKEKSVTRVTYEQLSPPAISVDTRTAINGDKRPK